MNTRQRVIIAFVVAARKQEELKGRELTKKEFSQLAGDVADNRKDIGEYVTNVQFSRLVTEAWNEFKS